MRKTELRKREQGVKAKEVGRGGFGRAVRAPLVSFGGLICADDARLAAGTSWLVLMMVKVCNPTDGHREDCRTKNRSSSFALP
jgi:hypothetical protein